MKAVARSLLVTTLVVASAAVIALQPAKDCAPAGSCQLRFDLMVAKRTYEVGEAIPLFTRLTNVGPTSIPISRTSERTGQGDGYRFEVFDADGRQVPPPDGRRARLFSSTLVSSDGIAPGRTVERRIMLNYQIARLSPGRYSIKGAFASASDVYAESNRIAIRVEPTSPDKVRQRIADLTADNTNDAYAALLGFTGDVAAIRPLVDLLYRKEDGAQVAALDAMLYLDRGAVEQSLLDALKERGPRERMVHFLVVELRAPNILTRPLLVQALRSEDANARIGAVEGLRLSKVDEDPELFAPLAAMLRDPDARVRHRASSAVGGYQNEQALAALTPLVDDPDANVSEQTTIAIGWIAQAAAVGSNTRRAAVDVLRHATRSDRRAVSAQAREWLARVGAE